MTVKQVVVRSSSLSGFPDCERRGAARMFRAEIEAAGHKLRTTPQGVGAAIGSSVHEGVAVLLQEKATTGTAAPRSVMADRAVMKYREIAHEGIAYDQETTTANIAETQVIRMAVAYQVHIEPTVYPILVEQRLEVDTGVGFILSGQSDLIAREPQTLRDLKTGKKRSNHKPQLGSYSLISRAHGHQIDFAKEDFVPRSPLTKAQADPQSFKHDLAHAEAAAWAVLKRIKFSLETFRQGSPEHQILAGDPWAFTANPSSMLCSAKFCPAHGTSWCHEWMEKEPK